jgi:hypothetical protein
LTQSKWRKITSHPESLQIQKKYSRVADIELAVDKVIVNVQWQVHGYGNITTIIRQCMDMVISINKGKMCKNHRKCELFYVYIIYKGKGGLQSTVSNG